MKELVKTLTSEFSDKEYAHAYVDDFSNMFIAAQIKALRDQRGWTQKELAEFSGMKQERVSALEDVNYEAWTAKTLKKLAQAFDLTLKISFEKFQTRVAADLLIALARRPEVQPPLGCHAALLAGFDPGFFWHHQI